VTVDIATHRPAERPFLVLATQNPIELEGTFPLPEAQLDRFLMKVAMGYPDAPTRKQHAAALRARTTRWTRWKKWSNRTTFWPCRETCAHARRGVGAALHRQRLPRHPQPRRHSELGASPRATMALYRTCQARPPFATATSSSPTT
jgi:MoxR-like ATPase